MLNTFPTPSLVRLLQVGVVAAMLLGNPRLATASSGSSKSGYNDISIGWMIQPFPTMTAPAATSPLTSFDFLSFILNVLEPFTIRGAHYFSNDKASLGFFVNWSWWLDIELTRATEKIFTHWSAISLGPSLKYFPVDNVFLHGDLGLTRLAGGVISDGTVRFGWHAELAGGVVFGHDRQGISISLGAMFDQGPPHFARAYFLRVGGMF
jgi:hypothetical protein